MKRFTLPLSALVLGVALLAAAPAEARPPVVLPSYSGRVGPYYHPYGQHMPGWDWWRTYPWSPYNYGRNPYNPIVYPYPVAVPYATPVPVQPPVVAPVATTPVVVESRTPHPTGDLKMLPANAGGVEVRVPAEFARVEFNGTQVSSVGTTRNYVTPDLPGGKPTSYTVTATWKHDGRSVTQEQQVSVRAGQTTVVDFTR